MHMGDAVLGDGLGEERREREKRERGLLVCG